jgi:pantoate kinase
LRRKAKAFAPAGISSFFEICDTSSDGTPLTDLEQVGSRGGGFGFQKGVTTEVLISESKKTKIQVEINDKITKEAETTKTVVTKLLKNTEKNYEIKVKHTIDVPIGCGFGTSAGGALSTGLALSVALDLHLTYNQIGKIAHTAEVQCGTGLGTVGPLMIGGCVITLEPGAPGISRIDRIPISPDLSIIAGVFAPTKTKQIITSQEKRNKINKFGRTTLDAILAEPSLTVFLDNSWNFAEKAGFATERTKELAKLALDAGAIGAAQNMVGEAVHAVVAEKNLARVTNAFKRCLPKEDILVSKIDFQGARLVSAD